SNDKLVEITSQRTGFSKADIQGILLALFDTTTDWINYGYRVELGEFGYFTGKIKGRLVEKKTDIRAPSIRFHNVNFRPSSKFKKALNGELSRTPSVAFKQSTNLDMEKLEKMLLDYLDKNAFINVVNYTRLTGRLKWKATQDIKHFVEKGVIESQGRGSHKVYMRKKE
ncbi:HU family DNA-binding protein, partial [Bacteroides sp. OttesenSCG-928-N06]|nr:HU family DNA-binding protein [Bacteroides sp. OttesenSCG-928-N06]